MRGWGDRALIPIGYVTARIASHATIGAMALVSVTLGDADPKTARVLVQAHLHVQAHPGECLAGI